MGTNFYRLQLKLVLEGGLFFFFNAQVFEVWISILNFYYVSGGTPVTFRGTKNLICNIAPVVTGDFFFKSINEILGSRYGRDEITSIGNISIRRN